MWHARSRRERRSPPRSTRRLTIAHWPKIHQRNCALNEDSAVDHIGNEGPRRRLLLTARTTLQAGALEEPARRVRDRSRRRRRVTSGAGARERWSHHMASSRGRENSARAARCRPLSGQLTLRSGRRVDDGRRGRRWHWPRAFSVCDRAPFAGPKDPLGDHLDGPAPVGHHSCGPVRRACMLAHCVEPGVIWKVEDSVGTAKRSRAARHPGRSGIPDTR